MPLKIVAIGEILWDVFPDGRRFGGAPANFASSASELSSSEDEIAIVSAVGEDLLGDESIQALKERGVSTTFVQRNPHPTGRVDIQLDAQGLASYQFDEDCAWDRLIWSQKLKELAVESDVVCFGTLGQRSIHSRQTIHQFLNHTKPTTLRIFDINIRQPYFQEALIESSLKLANILKLNDEELPILAAACKLTGSDEAILSALCKRFDLRLAALTRGGNGSTVVTTDHQITTLGGEVKVADTVGAGDAFTASLAVHLLRGMELERACEHANALAAYVCSQSGATMPFPVHLKLN
ncbi:MAG: carbohydrate kinase [Planctomycetota bacterium]|nr:carbohydrate kinase [Planctomycetota bacterium]